MSPPSSHFPQARGFFGCVPSVTQHALFYQPPLGLASYVGVFFPRAWIHSRSKERKNRRQEGAVGIHLEGEDFFFSGLRREVCSGVTVPSIVFSSMPRLRHVLASRLYRRRCA